MKIFAQSPSPRVHLHFLLCRQSLRLRSQFSARNPYEVSSLENFRSVLGIGNAARRAAGARLGCPLAACLQVLRVLILDKFQQNALRSAFRPLAGYGQTARTV